jgi:hypothetical protein
VNPTSATPPGNLASIGLECRSMPVQFQKSKKKTAAQLPAVTTLRAGQAIGSSEQKLAI